jgi:hypothetical protein
MTCTSSIVSAARWRRILLKAMRKKASIKLQGRFKKASARYDLRQIEAAGGRNAFDPIATGKLIKEGGGTPADA